MGKTIKLDILRPGKWKGKSGKVHNITKEQLQKLQNNYQNDEGPIVVGHPKEDSPAFGWWKKNKVSVDPRGHLVVEMSENDFDPHFLQQVKKKHYTTVSAATRKDGSLKHIGFLGATPPAVSGLDKIEFSEDENDFVFEFASYTFSQNEDQDLLEFSEYKVTDWTFRNIGNLFRGIKNYFIDELGQERADKIMPEHQIESTREAPEIFKPMREDYYSSGEVKEIQFSSNKNEDGSMNELEQLKAENEKLKAKITELDSSLQEANSKLSASEYKEKLSNAMTFCESDVMENRLEPALKNKVAHTLVALEQDEGFEFSEGDETIKANPVDVFKEVLKKLPVMEFSETATKNNAGDGGRTTLTAGEEMAKLYNG